MGSGGWCMMGSGGGGNGEWGMGSGGGGNGEWGRGVMGTIYCMYSVWWVKREGVQNRKQGREGREGGRYTQQGQLTRGRCLLCFIISCMCRSIFLNRSSAIFFTAHPSPFTSNPPPSSILLFMTLSLLLCPVRIRFCSSSEDAVNLCQT